MTTKRKKIKSCPIPVTVLSGFLGAGKTTILNNMLNNLEKKKIVVIVNDMSVVNIDASLIKRTDEKMIEMSNGCICCTLREDLLEQLTELGESSNADCIIIECTGIAEPLHVAETFAYADSIGKNLSSKVILDTTITVVDLQSFFVHFRNSEIMASHKTCKMEEVENVNEKSHADERTLSHLLVDQIQFADVIILNKRDVVPPRVLQQVQAVVADLNPQAKIIVSSRGSDIPINQLVDTGLFSFEKAEKNSLWFAEEWGTQVTPETEEYGISSVTFQESGRPFHPERLKGFFEQFGINSVAANSSVRNKLVRCKGFIWLASKNDNFILIHQTGGALNLQVGGRWWVDVDRDKWPNDDDFRRQVQEKIDRGGEGSYGDRGHTLVLIGLHLNGPAILTALKSCLLTSAEMESGPQAWAATLSDPFAYQGGDGTSLVNQSSELDGEGATKKHIPLPEDLSHMGTKGRGGGKAKAKKSASASERAALCLNGDVQVLACRRVSPRQRSNPPAGKLVDGGGSEGLDTKIGVGAKRRRAL